ncbi:MAG: hypothetical protein HY093_00645 [Candidatus Liptonbacteria bacterium]|nr:hypothetical protein [Candidatus Liptonbacteria bacterium]
MADQELVDYIKKCLAQGMSQEEITQALLKTGWQGSEVEESFRAVGESKFLATSGVPDGSVGSAILGAKSKKKIFLILGVLLLVIVLGGGFYWWQKSTVSIIPSKVSTENSQVTKDAKQNYEGKIYGSLDGYLAKSLEDYKKTHPSSTLEEANKFSEDRKNSYTKYREHISQVLAHCASSPKTVTSSIDLTIDFNKLSDSDPIFNQLKDSKIFPDPLVRGYAVYGDLLEGCVYKNAGDGKTWKVIQEEKDYFAFDKALKDQATKYDTCTDLPEEIAMTRGIGFLGEEVKSVISIPGNSNDLYLSLRAACLYKSSDAGSKWKRVQKEEPEFRGFNLFDAGGTVRRLFVDPNNTSHLYHSAGIESFDNGKNWQQVIVEKTKTEKIVLNGDEKTKFSQVEISNLAIAGDGKTLFAATVASFGTKTTSSLSQNNVTSSVYRSQDGGVSWRKMYDFLDDKGKVRRCGSSFIVIDPLNSSSVFVDCDDLFKSTDGGETWKVSLKDPPNIMIATKSFLYGTRTSAGAQAFFRSSDKGKTWNIKATTLGLWEIETLPSNEKVIYATSFDKKLYKSEDAGDSWKELPLPITFDQYGVLVGLLVHEPSGKVFVVSTGGLMSVPIE